MISRCLFALTALVMILLHGAALAKDLTDAMGPVEVSDAPPLSGRHAAGHCHLVFPADETLSRVFTYRRWYPDGAVDIDYALHHGQGPAARWIADAHSASHLNLRPGRPPKLKFAHSSGRLMMVADSARIPTVSALVEAHGFGAAVLPHAVTANRDTYQPVNARCFEREDDVLAAVYRAELTPSDTLFVACEASLMRRLRRHALDCRGLPANRVLTSGYWKHGHTTEAVDHLKQEPRWFGDSPAGQQRAAEFIAFLGKHLWSD